MITVLLIEDFPDWREKIMKHLRKHGIRVEAIAATFDQGEQLIKQQAQSVDAVLLDGRLGEDSDAGNKLGKLCKEIAPNTLRVGMSKYDDGVTQVDIIVGKDRLDELAETLLAYFTS